MPNPRRLSKAQSDALMEQMAREFAAMYARIEQDLLETMARDFARGYHARDASALRAEEIARLRSYTQTMLQDVQNQAPAMVQRMIDVASEQGALAGLAMLERSGFIGTGAALVQSPAVAAITAELVVAANNATRAILPSLDQFVRRAVAETVPDVLLGMGTSKQAQQRIWQRSLRQGITHITDASGRNWNLATYVEMASRTATRRAFTESSVHQMSSHGVELFTPVIGRDSCKSCAYWAGKILSRGTTGRVSMQHAIKDEMVTVDIDATVDEARSQGWQHPNCRCQLVAYIPGLSVVADSPGHDPVREGQRVKLRELERKVRAAKVDELAAVTPEQKARAKARTRDAQAAIREHVKEADIPRRRDREQLNLGHKDKPPRAKPKLVPGPPQDPMSPAVVRMTPGDAATATPRVRSIPAGPSGRQGAGVFARATQPISSDQQSGIEAYVSSGYERLNRELRAGKAVSELIEVDQKRIRRIDGAIDAQLPLESSATVYRELRGGLFAEAQPGDVLDDPAYQSTTLNKRLFGAFSTGDESVLMEIRMPAGAKGISANLGDDRTGGGADFVYQGEAEILLPRNTRLRVISNGMKVVQGFGRTRYIVAEYLV